ncbi:hypothetical protein ACNOYE_02235 [Nannocystaceae bacterium ST9]
MAERDDSTDPDREAILARRRHFIARALAQVESPGLGPRTGALVVAVASLATACPCLKMVPPPEPSMDESDSSSEESETGPDTDGSTGST